MSEQVRPPGQTTVSPEVLIDIVRLAALSVPGVHSLAPVPDGMNRIFTRGGNDGVQITIVGDTVNTAVYVIVDFNKEVLPISHEIQQVVARAITEMVGMSVGTIDVHVEDIHYQPGKED
ncbi:MAG: Asp23/Gls24 family envelope stress response protein [Anaerolineae bacterium]|nr:Asp23/Gls24 family envelope stress response protein [Anaerolineae bacterium]